MWFSRYTVDLFFVQSFKNLSYTGFWITKQPLYLIISFFLLFKKSGSHLLSHTVSSAVSSAAYGLTVVFGMGTGVSRKRITTGHLLSP